MFSTLAKNIALSAFSFSAVSLIGLLIVPALISAYGLAGFGLIAIGRFFLPTTALATLDLGYGEITINSVATSRATGVWDSCARLLSLNLAVACSVGIMAGIIMLVLASWIPLWFGVPAADQGKLSEVFLVNAALLPFFFSSLVAEGVLKGMESFGTQRLLEVLSTLAYAGCSLLAVGFGLDFRWVCYALLGSLLLRAAMAFTLAARVLRSNGLTLSGWTLIERDDFILRARGLCQNKLLGVVQAQSSMLLISIIFGPLALGTFEALSRLPRFAKSVLGLLASTVQPVAVRLEHLGDEYGLARLTRLGLILVASIAAPTLGLAIAFSEPLLRLWLGPDVSSLWGWQAAAFISPAFYALVSFGGSAILGRAYTMADMNRATLINVTVSIFVGLVLALWLNEMAFFVSQAVAVLVSVPWHLMIISRVTGLQSSTFLVLARIYFIALILALPAALVTQRIETFFGLISAMTIWTTACWITCLWIGLPASLRSRILWRAAAKLRICQ